MVRAVLGPEGGTTGPTSFAVHPQGIGSGDFSFVVIGDTGEGDASQQVLRDQLLSVANSPNVRFVVVSSDVVYPTGAMRDYEAKFWLPFKGVTRPSTRFPAITIGMTPSKASALHSSSLMRLAPASAPGSKPTCV
jgi:hypothetical protein